MKGKTDSSGMFNSLVDSTFSKVRISTRIADIGSVRLDSLVQAIEPKMKAIFATTGKDSISTSITGSTKIFIKGNKFLIDNLRESLLLAFILITLSMAILFANVRMIVISLLPKAMVLPNEENAKMMKPAKRTIDVYMMLLPVSMMVSLTARGMKKLLLKIS